MTLSLEPDLLAAGSLIVATLPQRIAISGIPLNRLSRSEALAAIEGFIGSGIPHQIVTVNVDFLNIAERDPAFVELLNRAALAVVDGMPLVWLSRLLGAPLPERITGSDLLLGSAALAAEKGYRIFLLGAAPGVAEEVKRRLEARYPGLAIAGCYAPPESTTFSAGEDERMVAAVRSARPDLLFTAFGTPKQEKWLFEHLQQLQVPVCIGVGGVFNFIAGRVPRAPRIMQQLGLEWLFRLLCEPGRLWRRYLLDDTRVLGRALLDVLGRRLR